MKSGHWWRSDSCQRKKGSTEVRGWLSAGAGMTRARRAVCEAPCWADQKRTECCAAVSSSHAVSEILQSGAAFGSVAVAG